MKQNRPGSDSTKTINRSRKLQGYVVSGQHDVVLDAPLPLLKLLGDLLSVPLSRLLCFSTTDCLCHSVHT